MIEAPYAEQYRELIGLIGLFAVYFWSVWKLSKIQGSLWDERDDE